MVDSIRPTHPSVPSSSSTRREQNASPVETHSDEKQSKNPVPGRPFKERRKNPDRRKNNSGASRAIYESRSGKDRRKNNPSQHSIEIDV